ncbi:MAG TPA: NADH-quinone oxidoreductase subunit L [Gammaproteobacteria bacterium]|nr:NADH-quinone oxidoreductase subunit L [Gammaproteobacteria bacterium]
MLHYLWLIPALPLIGFFILAVTAGRLPKPVAGAVGTASVGLSMLAVLAVWVQVGFTPLPNGGYTEVLWQWMSVGGFTPTISFYVDHLALIMMSVVTFVSFLIHLYSNEYMEDDASYSRFFAYMNLFVGSMLILVMAANLLFFYVGWEGVGLCSYLLIGFWYNNAAFDQAARKAFIVTRIGDTAMAIGFFLLFNSLGTLNIQELMHRASTTWVTGQGMAIAGSALILGGAVGKSAQFPLQVWLPDAMAGPTPVSALIHAATMVTAGVYIIARTHVLFQLAPAIQLLVAIIGALTLLIAGFSALGQDDIKRILAYSTISQIGYMFLALGVGAWSAAIFHLMTHAFFKALLFLAAGVVIHAMAGEHDIFKMGGLRKTLKVAFWPFLIGSAALTALPLITAGYYSKDLILTDAWTSQNGAWWLWVMGIVGAGLTGLYIFRAVFVAFFGEAQRAVSHYPKLRVVIPLCVLSFLSIAGGFVEIPPHLGDITAFTTFMASALPAVLLTTQPVPSVTLAWLQIAAGLVAFGSIAMAALLFARRAPLFNMLARSRGGRAIKQFYAIGCGFDWVYLRALKRPYRRLAEIDRNDIIDSFYTGIAALTRGFYYLLSATQTGRLRWYATGIAAGAVAFVALAVWR